MDPAETARAIIDANAYMTLGTADADGNPWATPVWFAPTPDLAFVWISKPEARHSRNIADRPQLGIVIFDSTQPPGTGSGVYAEAKAGQVPEDEIEAMTAIFSERSIAQGFAPLRLTDVHRLYRATPSQLYLLDEHDQRIPVGVYRQ
jgi:Pyridoxamine 5'-phosphate oxidase